MNELALPTSGGVAVEASGNMASLVNLFLAGRCSNTATAYQKDLEDFRKFVGAASAEEAAWCLLSRGSGPGNALAIAYKASLIDRGLAPATVNRRIQVLRNLVRTARTVGLVNWSLEVVSMKVVKYRDTRGPGVLGVRLLLDQVSGDSAKDRRDRAIIRLLFDLALRRSEVVSLDMEHLENTEDDNAALWVTRKGITETERLSLPAPTRAALLTWLEVRGTEIGPLFRNFDRAHKGARLTGSSVYRLVRGLGEQAGITARPHGIRHTAITEAVKKCQENGYPFELALDFSRHADVRTLMVYRDRERDAQREVASLVAGSVL